MRSSFTQTARQFGNAAVHRAATATIELLEDRRLFAIPDAVITALDTSTSGTINAYVGQAVHVDALGSDLDTAVGEPDSDFVRSNFEWDFGDTGSNYDVLSGFNAAHVYDATGTYTVSLKVTNKAGLTDTVTRSVSVTANPNRGSNNVIYVDAVAGNNTNDGLTPATAIATLAQAETMLATSAFQDDTSILLKYGQTHNWTTTGAFDVNYNNVRIGAYGDDTLARPLIQWTSTSQVSASFINPGNISNFVIENVRFNTPFSDPATWPADEQKVPKVMNLGSTDDVSNLVVRNTQFDHISSFLNVDVGANPDGVLVMDNSDVDAQSLRRYMLFGGGSNLVVLGNVVHNSVNEHPIRLSDDATGALFAYNDIANLDKRVSGIPTEDVTPKGSFTLQDSHYVWVAHNTVRGGPLAFGPLGGGDGTPTDRASYGVIEANTILDPNNVGSRISVVHGAEHVMIRNNVVDNSTSSGDGIVVDGLVSAEEGVTYNRTTIDVGILFNTVTRSADTSGIHIGSNADGPYVFGNLVDIDTLTPTTSKAGFVSNDPDELAQFADVGENIWPEVEKSTYAGTGTTGQKTHSAWTSLLSTRSFSGGDEFLDIDFSSGYVPDAAAKIASPFEGVFTDFNGNPRPTSGAWTAGAVELAAPIISLPAAEDAHVRDGANASTNYGAATTMEVKVSGTSGNTREAYLTFDVRNIGTVTSAKLKLNGFLTNGTDTVNVAAYDGASTSWDEDTVTWNNKPGSAGSALATTAITSTAAQTYEWDLTSWLQAKRAAGATTVTVVLKSTGITTAIANFNSEEAASNDPALEVVGTQVFSPDDAHVRDGANASTNYGTSTAMEVKVSGTSGNTREAYLKFDLTNLGTVGSATLRLFGFLTNGTDTVTVEAFDVTSTSWTEGGVTWNTKPSSTGSALDSAAISSTTGQWYEWDLTSWLQAKKTAGATSASLALKSTGITTAIANFTSGEGASNLPELLVTP